MEKGKFIVLEGIDGCGKSTQVKKATAYLFDKSKEFDVYLTREPTRNSKEIRERLSSGSDVKKDSEWYAKNFTADRFNHVDLYIRPAINRGTHVLCDRYKHSTLAYQWSQGMDIQQLLTMQGGLMIPDLTFICDCPAKIAIKRRAAGGATDVFERGKELSEVLSFQEQLQQNYLNLIEYLPGEKIVIIDASKSADEVFEQTKKHLDDLFNS